VKYFFTLLIVGAFLCACKKEDPKPSVIAIDTNLLAGESGGSKTWLLTSITTVSFTGQTGSVSLTSCITDNLYKFSNNGDQTYEVTEGGTKCIPSDPDVIESGNWALSPDGKVVMILSNSISNQSSTVFSFEGLAFPAEVLNLTDSTFQIQMNYTLTQGAVSQISTYTLSFVKA
jgi:hypothetical protein